MITGRPEEEISLEKYRLTVVVLSVGSQSVFRIEWPLRRKPFLVTFKRMQSIAIVDGVVLFNPVFIPVYHF